MYEFELHTPPYRPLEIHYAGYTIKPIHSKQNLLAVGDSPFHRQNFMNSNDNKTNRQGL